MIKMIITTTIIIIITIIILSKTIQNYQKNITKIMLQYLPLIAQCTKKSDTPEIIMQHEKMKLKFYLKIKNLLTYLLLL